MGSMKLREGYRWTPRTWAPNVRQGAILNALLEGRTNAEIGRDLGISAGGVKWYVSQFLLETGLSNRRELARWWRARSAVAADFQSPTMLSDAEALMLSWPASGATPDRQAEGPVSI
jgi:DNA-binding CsgD family transcriptional regulator